MIADIAGLLVVGFFLYGFYRDGKAAALEEKRIGDYTLGDLLDLGLLLVSVIAGAALVYRLSQGL